MKRTTHKNQLPTIVLVGRANVGKSTLFNTLLEHKKALVSTIAGTTRTNNEGVMVWRGKEVLIIDTGGLDSTASEEFATKILDQAEQALSQADIIVMVTDARSGILPQEKELSKKLLTHYKHKPILLIANKTDNKKLEQSVSDQLWFSLGLGQPFPVSATNGRGVGDFLDLLFEKLETVQKVPPAYKKPSEEIIEAALIGKPNVGKSSLFNKLINQEKVIVSDIAHTTREPFDTQVNFELDDVEHTIVFTDTAGIRRKSKVSGELEREGIGKTLKTILSSDIILLTLDGNEPLSSQDMQLGGLIERRSKSVIILINKWDLTEDNSDAFRNDVKRMIYAHLPHLDFAPLLFVSGKTGYKVNQIFPLIVQVENARKTVIPQSILDKFISQAIRHHKPSRGKGTRQPEILGFKQINTNPPIFELFVKMKTSLHRSYLSYLENRLREEYNFIGCPIVIKITKMKK